MRRMWAGKEIRKMRAGRGVAGVKGGRIRGMRRRAG
jgi:hypothetical protein